MYELCLKLRKSLYLVFMMRGNTYIEVNIWVREASLRDQRAREVFLRDQMARRLRKIQKCCCSRYGKKYALGQDM
jgi:hypothetical protein